MIVEWSALAGVCSDRMTLRELAWAVDAVLGQRWREVAWQCAAIVNQHAGRPISPHKLNPYRGLWARDSDPDHDPDMSDLFSVE